MCRRREQRVASHPVGRDRRLASGYRDSDAALVHSLRLAIGQVVEQIVVHPLEAVEGAVERPDESPSVFLVGRCHLVELVARETFPQPVKLKKGRLCTQNSLDSSGFRSGQKMHLLPR